MDAFLAPYKAQLKSLAVESTYNWYWLVDGLQALGYPVKLANPAAIDQYSGIKHAGTKPGNLPVPFGSQMESVIAQPRR